MLRVEVVEDGGLAPLHAAAADPAAVAPPRLPAVVPRPRPRPRGRQGRGLHLGLGLCNLGLGVALHVLGVVVRQGEGVGSLHVGPDGGVLVDHVLAAPRHLAPVLLDDLPAPPELGSVVLHQQPVVIADVVLVDPEGSEGLRAEHAEIFATLRPALGLWPL